ncbi:MAG: DeoR/GlpR family DNA-binding transcription regulator [Lentisphaeria bacterium]|nr:DeoR/GlpR family DNA-binding transcription regulator [Lentisphaeria bacterium]
MRVVFFCVLMILLEVLMKTLRSFQMIAYLRDRKHCSVGDLIAHFQVSPATIYRSIDELTERGALQRVRGGVVLREVEESVSEPASPTSHFLARINRNSERKQKIARLALGMISDGNILFLDSSTTSLYLARALQKADLSNLTIITNSVLIIQEFYLFPPHYVLISTGGNFTAHLNSFLGKSALDNLQHMKIDKIFFSAVGLQEGKATTFHEEHALFLRRVLPLAEQRFLLLDSSKFDKAGLFEICRQQDAGTILSDKKVPGVSPSAKNDNTSVNLGNGEILFEQRKAQKDTEKIHGKRL